MMKQLLSESLDILRKADGIYIGNLKYHLETRTNKRINNKRMSRLLKSLEKHDYHLNGNLIYKKGGEYEKWKEGYDKERKRVEELYNEHKPSKL